MSKLSFLADDASWAAVTARDRRSDGRFVYGAVTTGIYCRPSCPARSPRRRNTLIFSTSAEAERHGYAACRRCYPNSLTPAEQGIKGALDYIEAHLDEAITLETLSQESGFSAHHFRETFQRIVGVTPKEFRDVRRLARFKQLLKSGQSVSAACYAAGYGSSRALYEKTRSLLGMTPGDYQRGAKGIGIHYSLSDSLLGRVLVGRSERGVCGVWVGEPAEPLRGELHREFPCAVARQEKPDRWVAAVHASEAEDPLLVSLPLELRRRIFQARFWIQLK